MKKLRDVNYNTVQINFYNLSKPSFEEISNFVYDRIVDVKSALHICTFKERIYLMKGNIELWKEIRSNCIKWIFMKSAYCVQFLKNIFIFQKVLKKKYTFSAYLSNMYLWLIVFVMISKPETILASFISRLMLIIYFYFVLNTFLIILFFF